MTAPVSAVWAFGRDRQVVDALRTVFDKFFELGSARQVALWVLDQGMKLPRRDKRGMIRWIEPSSHAVYHRVAGHWRQRIERAEYEAERARGRYEAVDANNRLVAAELERRWNEALTIATDVRRDAEERIKQLTRQLSDFERERVRRMAHDISKVWTAASTTARDKKRLLRAAIERVVITSTERAIKVAVEWKGGEITEEEFARRRRGEPTLVTDADVVELVRRLSAERLDDTQIARVLSRRGMRTATGLTFTKRRVQSVRACYELPCGSTRSLSTDEPLYTAEDAARELGVSSPSAAPLR